MRSWLGLWLSGGTLLLAQGCWYSNTVNATRRTHAANFSCDPGAVRVEEVSYDGGQNRGTFLAEGCGVRQTYLCVLGSCAASGSPVLTTGGDSAPVLAGTCSPPCSPGFGCEAGVCRGLCNPECGVGQRCLDDRLCHPAD
jgi:hypothetical protein